MSIPLLGVIPLLLAWVGCFGVCRELAARKKILPDWRVSWILACAFWGALLTLVVEGCSAIRQLNAATVFIVWTILGTSLAGAAFSLARKRGAWSRAAWAKGKGGLREGWTEGWPLDAKLMLGGSVVLIAVLGVAAAIFPTTNWDSLTYHLPRVVHWIQQQSVEHYPTHNTRQIEFGPWAGFVLTQLHLLAGSDQLDNLVQWFAMLTSVIVATFIAQQLLELSGHAGSDTTEPATVRIRKEVLRRVSGLTALLVTTLPTGIVESITTQTDYVVTCWYLGLTCLLLALRSYPANVWHCLGAGLALGLGVLTKATMLIYAAPLGIAFVVWWLFLPDNRVRLRFALILTVCLMALNTPHWHRNFAVFGSPLGSRYILSVERNATVSVAGTFSNLIRNLILQTNTGIQPLTDAINGLLISAHELTGRDVNDQDTTYHLGAFELPRKFVVQDTESSNFYHLLLIATAGLSVAQRPRRNLVWIGYGLIVLSGFLLFCILLRWQKWHSRIHLTWLVWLMPWVGAIAICKWRLWFVRIAASSLFLLAGYCAVNYNSRPLLGLDAQDFRRDFPGVTMRRAFLHDPLAGAAHDIVLSHCKHVALVMDFDAPEYPVWVLLRKGGFTGRIDNFAVRNESARIVEATGQPCAILSASTDPSPSANRLYAFESDYGPIRVFWSEPASRWAELALLKDQARTALWLPPRRRRVEFDGQTLAFGLRTPRAGRLHLAGIITDAKGNPAAKGSLRISTRFGFEQTLALNGQPFELAVPSGGGPCLLEAVFSDSQLATRAVWDEFSWSWEPGESPEGLPR